MRWRAWMGAATIMGLVLGASGGCATTEDSARLGSAPQDRPPADPVYQRTWTTPKGNTWEFQLGGYQSDR